MQAAGPAEAAGAVVGVFPLPRGRIPELHGLVFSVVVLVPEAFGIKAGDVELAGFVHLQGVAVRGHHLEIP